jgi:sortase A
MIVPVKAYVAPYLLNYAWEETLKQQKSIKPWPWLDSEPVAKISFESYDTDFVILRGVSGQVLAFAPGWHDDSAVIGQGSALISAHRDTHFEILQYLQVGDVVKVQNLKGMQSQYKVIDMFIAETPQLNINPDENALYFVTCYPFDMLSKNPQQRYIVKALVDATKG